MTLKTEGVRAMEWLIDDEESRSYDEVTITVSGSTAMKSGTVLGKITATGKYVAYSNAASDGSEVARAILRNESPSVNGDYKVAALVREAEVQAAMLTGIDTPAKADLLAAFVVVR